MLASFRSGGVGTDYIENQCSKVLPDCSYTTLKSDVTVTANDDVLFSRTTADCQRYVTFGVEVQYHIVIAIRIPKY